MDIPRVNTLDRPSYWRLHQHDRHFRHCSVHAHLLAFHVSSVRELSVRGQWSVESGFCGSCYTLLDTYVRQHGSRQGCHSASWTVLRLLRRNLLLVLLWCELEEEIEVCGELLGNIRVNDLKA